MLRLADHIIAISERTKSDLIEIFQIKANKITVIYEGVKKNFYEKPTRNEMWDVHQRFNIHGDFILFVGTIRSHKNIEQLINAFRTADPTKLGNKQLVLVGPNGNATDTVKTLVDNYCLRNLQEAVREVEFSG